tara:strand:+ start:163 stop:372 length:210 start_codon:yes stop_codon:yes gene_type:complete
MKNTPKSQYIWLWRRVKHSELDDHRIYKAVPWSGKSLSGFRPGGWSYVDKKQSFRNRDNREYRDTSSQG